VGENEMLAMRAKQGDTEATGELWERVRLLIYKLQGKYVPLCDKCGIEREDLRQSGFFALLAAVKAFNPDKGFPFTAYLNHHVASISLETLGLRGHKTRPQNVRSLDEPIPGAEGDSITLGDTVPDAQAAEELERVERDLWNEQLHNALEGCLSALTDDQSDVIRARFYNGYTLKEAAERDGRSVERIRQLEGQGLRGLRKPQNRRRLKAFREDIISTRAYQGTGWAAFSASLLSSVEKTVERLEELLETTTRT